jgi:hypothetical protein
MALRAFVAVFLAGIGATALCQPPPKLSTSSTPFQQMATVPDYILWDAFFFRVNWLNDLAGKLEAKGHSGANARSEIARRAHLTSQQQQALNAIAGDYRAASHAIYAQIVALIQSGPGSNPQQLQNLQNQRMQTALDHMAQVQAAFGNTSFQAFSGYVHGTEVVKAYAAAGSAQPGKEQP